MKYPNLYIAGAPKCGTTSLAYYLGQHSEVFAPLVKEPMFFGKDLIMKADSISERDYAKLYSEWNSEKYAIDATPAYLVSQKAAQEIKKASPDAKILICVRSPADAVLSSFYHNRYRQSEHLKTLEDALAAESERSNAGVPPKFGTLQTLMYTALYSYASNIGRFDGEFGHENVKIVVLDDLKSQPEETVRQIFEWLGISQTEEIEFRIKNSAASARTRLISRIAIHPPIWMGALTKPFFSAHTRLRVRETLRSLNSKVEPNPSMAPETRRKLNLYFRTDVEWLSQRLGRDLGHWCDNDT